MKYFFETKIRKILFFTTLSLVFSGFIAAVFIFGIKYGRYLERQDLLEKERKVFVQKIDFGGKNRKPINFSELPFLMLNDAAQHLPPGAIVPVQ